MWNYWRMTEMLFINRLENACSNKSDTSDIAHVHSHYRLSTSILNVHFTTTHIILPSQNPTLSAVALARPSCFVCLSVSSAERITTTLESVTWHIGPPSCK